MSEPPLPTTSILDAAGGPAAMQRLAHAWHERVLADEVVSHAFSHGFRPDHTERLAAYFVEAFGGPAVYTGELGAHSEVVRIHSGNGVHTEMDDRALHCFELAIADVGLDADPELKAALIAYWVELTERMNDYAGSADEVPHDLAMPRWGWQGQLP